MELLQNGRVSLFNLPITIDRELPKYKLDDKNISTDDNYITTSDDIEMGTPFTFLNINNNHSVEISNTPISNLSDNELWVYQSSENPKKSIFTSISKYVNAFYVKIFTKKKKEPKKISIFDFFNDVKRILNESELQIYENEIDTYIKQIDKAVASGQTALFEKLTKALEVKKQEAYLISKGYTHILTQEDIVKLGNNSERGICIDYMKNFTRLIPDDVLEKKQLADKLNIFDNYVIMHFDPQGKNSDLTDAEKEARAKDPILFGVIQNSENLYYIADWEDEYCNLTLAMAMRIIANE